MAYEQKFLKRSSVCLNKENSQKESVSTEIDGPTGIPVFQFKDWNFVCSVANSFFFFHLFYLYGILSLSSDTPEEGITDGCEPPCGCWEMNSGPLEEQSVLSTAEPSISLAPEANYFVLG
jgi:hypothetical protein